MSNAVKLSFLATLLAEIETVEVPEGWDPFDDSPADGEVPLGTANDAVKKTLFYKEQLRRELRKNSTQYEETQGSDHAAEIKLSRLKSKYKLVGNLYWEEVRAQFGDEFTACPESPGVGVRKGWQVVALSPDHKDTSEEPQVRVMHVTIGGDMPPGLFEALRRSGF